VRQLLTESIVLASMGGVLALAMAWWGTAGLVRMISTGESPAVLDARPDWRVFGFTAAASLLTGILFGLAPAVRGTRVDPGPAMKESRGNTGRSSHALDRMLIVAQVALSVVLMMGAGLFVRTLHGLWSVNPGYDRENVLMFSADTRLAGYPTERAGAVYREILERIRVLRGADSASASLVRPLDDHFYLVDRVSAVEGRQLPERDTIRVAWNAVSPGFFSTVGMRILLGRDFDARDDETAPKVVIVNESLARRAFPNQDPIGRRLDAATVVGMVKDAHYNGVRDQPRPVLYHPLFQYGRAQGFQWGFVSFELRYRAGSELLEQVRREVASVDRNLPIFRARTLVAQTEQSLLRERLLATLSSFFGALALVLACLGLFGLMAYAVTRRTAEIGIRMALGARRGQILWLMLRGTLGLVLAGLALGIPLALWTARYAKSLLFGVGTADPLTVTITIVALIGVAALAAWIPARRATRVDPMAALRYE
jgi:predicted permease